MGYQTFQEDEFKQQVFIYTLEIGVDPSNVGFYVDRALAKIELKNFRGKLKTMIFWFMPRIMLVPFNFLFFQCP